MKAICKNIPKTILFVGPPGSGKDTQADKIADLCGGAGISSGAMMIKELNLKSDLGKKADEFRVTGELVPDDLIYQIIEKRLRDFKDYKLWIFTGVVRTLNQVPMFDRVLKDYGRKLEAVVYIDISEQTAINRISKRTYCKKCGTTYHPVFKPSKREGFCDNDGEPLFQRSDDKAEIVKERFKAEMGNTEEVLKEYDKRDIVHRINGEPSIVQIHNTILEMLSNEA